LPPHVPPSSMARLVTAAEVHGWSVAFLWAVALFAAGAVATLVVLPRGRPPTPQHGGAGAVA